MPNPGSTTNMPINEKIVAIKRNIVINKFINFIKPPGIYFDISEIQYYI